MDAIRGRVNGDSQGHFAQMGGWQGSPFQANFAQMLGQLLAQRNGGFGAYPGMGGMQQMGGGFQPATMQMQQPAWAMSRYGMMGSPLPFGNKPINQMQMGNMNLSNSFVSMLNDIRQRRMMQQMPQAQTPSQPKNAGAGR